MKPAKKIKKAHVALAVMVIALSAAVWLNMKYGAAGTEPSSQNTSSKYLGQAEYVNAEVGDVAEEDSYFASLRADRKKARDEALDIIEETLDRDDLTEEERRQALEHSESISEAAEAEVSIETVLKAKGYENVLAVIGEKDVNVIIKGELTAAVSAQIRDAVFSYTDFEASQIKIISAD